MTAARDAATRVLERVDKEQAFAAAALESELSRNVQLEARDRALATELVYGTLRVQPWLLQQIDRHAPRGTAKLDVRVRSCLALAAYQLAFMRVPAFAAVHEAVDAVRAARGERMAAFANAVLRKVAGDLTGAGDEVRAQALLTSTPAWLHEALDRSLSPEDARAFASAGAAPPPIALRIERAAERGTWIDRLRAAAPEASIEPGARSPLAVLVRGAGKPQRLPGWSEGAWSVQEEGSQVAALAVGVREGDAVLDACAGRGNKTAILVRAGGLVDACDAMPSKLERLREELARIGLGPRSTHAVDWRAGSGDVRGSYDRILVDAPCTGIGTLRRRPEILLRRADHDLAAMGAAQVAIVERAAGHLRPGGSLTYVVCSVLREECEDVVERARQLRPELEPEPFDDPSAIAIAGAGAASMRLLPHRHGTDGYFVARLRSGRATL